LVEKKKYWLEDVTGKHYIFEAESMKEAHHYFMMEGDHAWDYGVADKEYFIRRLKGEEF
jgi:hypothetical protein